MISGVIGGVIGWGRGGGVRSPDSEYETSIAQVEYISPPNEQAGTIYIHI